jgi:hypothetical protein
MLVRRMPHTSYAADRDAGGTRLVRLAGRYVAFDNHTCFTIYCVHALVRADVRSGRRRSFDEPPIGQSEAGPALDLEVTERGTVVWIRAVANPAAARFDIGRWDGTEVSVPDSGPLSEVRPGRSP